MFYSCPTFSTSLKCTAENLSTNLPLKVRLNKERDFCNLQLNTNVRPLTRGPSPLGFTRTYRDVFAVIMSSLQEPEAARLQETIL